MSEEDLSEELAGLYYVPGEYRARVEVVGPSDGAKYDSPEPRYSVRRYHQVTNQTKWNLMLNA
jgi:hypothetical protein